MKKQNRIPRFICARIIAILAAPAVPLAASAESVCGFDGNRWLIGYDEFEAPIYDQGLVTGWTDYVNNNTYSRIEQPFDANDDGDADTGMRLPWRTVVTPNGVEYPSAANNTHAGTAPIWGGWEWVAYSSEDAVFSNTRFCINETTGNSGHQFAESFNYRLDFPANGSSALYAGEVSGLTILTTTNFSQSTKKMAIGINSKFHIKVHSNDNTGFAEGRFALEIAPSDAVSPADYVILLSDAKFTYASSAIRELVLDKDTAFYKHTPYACLRFDSATADGPFYPPFENVIGAGYYFHNDVSSNSSYLQRLTTRVFDFNAVPPPNPATMILIK